MFQLRTLHSPIGENLSGGGENGRDEMEILMDQDETNPRSLADVEDQVMGGLGTEDEFGMGTEDFALGEIDVAEQMARTSAQMEKAAGRLDSDLTHIPHKHITNDDAAPTLNPNTYHEAASTHKPSSRD